MAVYDRALQPSLLDASCTHFRTQSTYAKAMPPPADELLIRFFLSYMMKSAQYEQNVV
jgi:hypothetical protein